MCFWKLTGLLDNEMLRMCVFGTVQLRSVLPYFTFDAGGSDMCAIQYNTIQKHVSYQNTNIKYIHITHIFMYQTGYALEMPFSGKWETETKPIPIKWQPQKPNTKPIFILAKNTNTKPNFNKAVLKITDKIPRKYREIWDINTKYRFGIGIFLVYQIPGYRLTSLVCIHIGKRLNFSENLCYETWAPEMCTTIQGVQV